MNKRLLFIAIAILSLSAVTGCKKAEGPDGGDAPASTVDIFGEDLFVKFTDPSSGVVSYRFRNEAIGLGKINTQSNYFVTKSMTDDERFFFMFFSAKEVNGQQPAFSGGRVVDLQTRKLITFPGNSGCYPYMDVKEDKLYYFVLATASNGVRDHGRFYMKDLKNGGKTVELAEFPSAIAPKGCYINRPLSHITLTQDRRKVFLDAVVNNVFYQGLLDLYTGEWTEWSHNSTVHLTHGQLNPTRDDEALLAVDVWTKGDGEKIPIVNDPDGTYPRMQLMKSDGTRRTIKPSMMNGATHEGWMPDGNTVYFCADLSLDTGHTGAFHYRNIRTDEYKYVPVGRSTHCNPTADAKYVVHDDDRPYGEYTTGFYRGGPWRVWF